MIVMLLLSLGLTLQCSESKQYQLITVPQNRNNPVESRSFAVEPNEGTVVNILEQMENDNDYAVCYSSNDLGMRYPSYYLWVNTNKYDIDRSQRFPAYIVPKEGDRNKISINAFLQANIIENIDVMNSIANEDKAVIRATLKEGKKSSYTLEGKEKLILFCFFDSQNNSKNLDNSKLPNHKKRRSSNFSIPTVIGGGIVLFSIIGFVFYLAKKQRTK